MKVAVFGCGYVGLVTAAGLADIGHEVFGIERDPQKLESLTQGRIPIYEQGLEPIVRKNLAAGKIRFTHDPIPAIRNAAVLFITVGTPSLADGSADLSQVDAVAKEIASEINEYKVIVDKSTVPVGTARRVRRIIEAYCDRKITFDIVSNPEFLREGSAVQDFIHPDRIVIGSDSPRAEKVMAELYQEFIQQNTPIIWTNPETAELIKYASNGFLATKITFMNELISLCDAVNADITKVAAGMGLDHRIGPDFLHPGPGYGGSCFPKDTRALIHTAHAHDVRLPIIETVVHSNEMHKQKMIHRIQSVIGDLAGKTITVLGLAFKANTDDVRESPALAIISGLLAAGARVIAHDPKAFGEARKVLGDQLIYREDMYEAMAGADCCVIATEWEDYQRLDLGKVKDLLHRPIIVDLRNILDPKTLKAMGFQYTNLGNGSIRR